MRTIDLFPVLSTSPWRGFFEPAAHDSSELETYVPRSFVNETKDHYAIELDVPGLKKEDVKLELEERLLTISGERKDRYRLRKIFNLPDDVDLENIQAAHKDGVLTLSLPKTARAKARTITIAS